MEETPEPTKYHIATQWYEKNNRSFRAMAQKRFCAKCQAKIGSEVEERVPTYSAALGRVVFEVRKVPFGTNPFSVIKDHCSKEHDYITPDTPLLEALFRLFLANGNQPSDAVTLQELLAQYVPLYSRSHGYSHEFLERLMETDDYYGIRKFEIEEAVEVGQ